MPAGVSAITPLANLTLGTAANTITFTSISGAYRDLFLVVNYNNSSNFVRGNITFNNDSSQAYNSVYALGNGSTATSSSASSASSLDPTGPSDNSSGAIGYIAHFFDYAQTDKHKSVLWRVYEPGGGVIMNATRYGSTNAITSIQIVGNFSRTFPVGSTFALYGVSS